MVNVILYAYNGDNRVINKDLTQIAEVTCSVYGDCSITDPALLLKSSSGAVGANYCYVSQWGRYYYINSIQLSNGTQAVINCHVDVLKTYANAIYNSPALCIRNESIGINDVNDPQLPLNDEKSIKVATLGVSLNKNGSYPYVLNVAGGGGDN